MRSIYDVITKDKLACKDKEKIIAVTHGGDAHPDDAFAGGFIKLLWGSENVTFIRSRSMEDIVKGDIIFDVGRQYDGKRYFDHHQKEDPTIVESNGLKHSAFSLFTEAVISDKDVLAEFNRRMAYGIAVRDNGQKDFGSMYQSLGLWVGIFNLTYDEIANGKDQDKQFDLITEYCKAIIERQLIQILALSESRTEVRKCCESAIDGKILVLPQYMPYTEALQQYPLIELVVYKHKTRDEWLVSVPPTRGQGIDNRTLLPIFWRGYDKDIPWRKELDPLLEKCNFVNSNGFIGSWQDADSAIAACEFTIRNNSGSCHSAASM